MNGIRSTMCLGFALAAFVASAEPRKLFTEKPQETGIDDKSLCQSSIRVFVPEDKRGDDMRKTIVEGCSDSEWAAVNDYFNGSGCYATSCSPMGGGWVEVGVACP